MEQDYNFWRDLLDTYQSLPDWLKLVWLRIPAAMITAAGNALTRLISGQIVSMQAARFHDLNRGFNRGVRNRLLLGKAAFEGL